MCITCVIYFITIMVHHNFCFKYGTSFALWRYYYENYRQYFSLLSKTRKENNGEQTELIVFVLGLLRKSSNNIHEAIIRMIDSLLFKDYISFLLKQGDISSRQYAIISFILDTKAIPTKELQEHPAIQEFYKNLESKTRLFQLDMQNLTTKFSLLKIVKIKDVECYIPNYEYITKAE